MVIIRDEYYAKDRDICNRPVRCDLAGVGQNIDLLHMIGFILHESVQFVGDGAVSEALGLDTIANNETR